MAKTTPADKEEKKTIKVAEVNYATLENMRLWAQTGHNVLLRGKHGIGKTEKIMTVFKEMKWKFRVFSAATLDPWVDLIGIPKATGKGKNQSLTLVRPEGFSDNSIEAIFFDEGNRAQPKVMNAIMELIQFRSINGHHFPKLKAVWMAVNPDDKNEEGDLMYHVNRLDPAQLDRFQVIVDVPYVACRDWFFSKFGQQGAAAVDWWNGLDDAGKDAVTPRRLAYAVEAYGKTPMQHILPQTVNISKFNEEMEKGSYTFRMKEIFDKKDTDAAEKAMKEVNFYANTIKTIVKSKELMEFFLPYVAVENLFSQLENDDVFDFVTSPGQVDNYRDDLNALVDANAGHHISEKLRQKKFGSKVTNLKNPLLKAGRTEADLKKFNNDKKFWDALINNPSPEKAKDAFDELKTLIDFGTDSKDSLIDCFGKLHVIVNAARTTGSCSTDNDYYNWVGRLPDGEDPATLKAIKNPATDFPEFSGLLKRVMQNRFLDEKDEPFNILLDREWLEKHRAPCVKNAQSEEKTGWSGWMYLNIKEQNWT